MKCTIPEISWHNRDPVLSVDIQPNLTNEFYRLATGGTDSHVLIWHLRILETGACSTEPVSDLTRHQKAVNVVRWSPNGQFLASGDDDANIIIWQHKPDAFCEMLDGETQDKEKWSVFKVLRGHKEDIYDISWSPNNQKLISGSVDNTAIIWDLNKGNNDNILTDHKGFVQGVCWDPKSDYLATLSSDRICRIFNETGKNVKNRISKGVLNLPESHPLHGQIVRYYHDDTLKSFFRRLTFSPDGNLLITPAGFLEYGPDSKQLYTTYIYSINNFSQPVAILPSPTQYTIAVRCCPILFELHPDGPEPAIALPYRMVIAVATRSSVILYDTQQLTPFAVISNIHYTRLTDLTWSTNGQILVVSSTDGFCSLVTFEPNELGTEYTKSEESDVENMEVETEKVALAEPLKEEKEVKKAQDPIEKEKEKKRPSFLMQWAKAGENKTDIDKKNTVMKEKDTNIIVIEDSPKKDPQVPIATSNVAKNLQNTLSSAPKPIEVRRKPRNDNSTPQIPPNPTNDAPKPIEVRKKPREEPIKSDDTPKVIEVRKKPRSPESDTQSPASKKPKLPPSSNVEAKPIAVRRKPKEVPTDQKESPKPSSAKKKPVQKKTKENTDSEVIILDENAVMEATLEKKVTENQVVESTEKELPKLKEKELEKVKKVENEVNSPKSLSKKKKADLNSSVNSPTNSGSKKKGQMDITKFFKGPFEKPETKSRISLFSEKKTEVQTKKDDSDSDCVLIEDNIKLMNTENGKSEDTQDLRLVIEDTEDTKPVVEKECSLDKFEEFYESQTKSSPEQSCSKNLESTEQNGGSKSLNTQEQKSVNDLKNKVSEIHLQSPVQKKKVPFITLSSPKNKKNKS